MEAPMRLPRLASFIYLAILLIVCGSIGSAVPAVATITGGPTPSRADGSLAAAAAKPIYREVGLASWYGAQHQGRVTASGEIFDQNRLTAAHRRLPLDTKAKVTNLENGRSVEVKVNDRGPYVHGRVIDLSARAARELGMTRQGIALVKIEVLGDETASSAMD
jgi:rare lipoprotein A